MGSCVARVGCLAPQEIVNNNAKIRARECMAVFWVKETSTVYSIISQGCTKTFSGTSSP
jgi:hypothetical protein